MYGPTHGKPLTEELPYAATTRKGLVILGERDEALGQAWNLPSAQTVTTRQFIEMIFAETGYPARIQAVPNLILKTLALFNPTMREVAEMLYEFEEPFIADHSRFERTFSNHATPLQEAIHTTLEWFRKYEHEKVKSNA